MRDSTIIYRSFYEAIKELPPEHQAHVWSAICEYALDFEEIELKGMSKTVFRLIKPQLDANLKRYQNGLKPKSKRTEANQKQIQSKSVSNVNDNDNVNENHNQSLDDLFLTKKKGKDKSKDFAPPSLEEWVDYFKLNGYRVDVAEKSWKSYDVANWKDSKGNLIRNWKQKAIHVWFTEGNKEGVQNGTAGYRKSTNYRPTL